MLPSPRPALSAVLLTGMNCAKARTTSKPPSRRSFAPPLNGFARPFHHRRRADPAKTRQRPLLSLTPPRTRVPVTHRLRVRQGAAHIAADMVGGPVSVSVRRCRTRTDDLGVAGDHSIMFQQDHCRQGASSIRLEERAG